MTVVELFSGAGGASLGLVAAGFTEVRAVEWNHDACETRRAAGLRCDEGDVRDPAHYVGVQADAVWSSFPCQAWSTAGKRLGKDDPRNGWPWTVDVLDQVKPRWFMAENVPGLTHHRAGCNGRCVDDCARLYFEQTILADLGARFASVQWSILDAARFGVPQNRERLIIVAGPRPIVWPRETHAPPEELNGLFETRKPWVTVRQALGLVGQRTPESAVGGNLWTRATPDTRPAPTVNGKGNTYVHPSDPGVRMTVGSSQTSGRKGGRTPCGVSVDTPAPTVRACEGVGLTIHVEPWPSWRDRCVPLGGSWYDYAMAAGHPEDAMHPDGVTRRLVSPVPMPEWAGGDPRFAIMREDPSRGWEAHGIDEPSPAVRAGRPSGGLGTRAGSRPELLDKPSPAILAREVKGNTGDALARGRASAIQCASDVAFLGAGIRRLTPAECATLQAFPSDHPWRGTKTSIYAQIGNAVPPTLARVVAEAVKAADPADPRESA